MKRKLSLVLMLLSASAGPELLFGQAWRAPSAKRIVAIGDLHGDHKVALKALRLAGAVDTDGRWTGGDMIVVQVGDQIDRWDDDREVIDLFERLRVEAKAAGGEVHPLLGNHETMNVYGDFSYVSDGAFKDFTQHVPWTIDLIPDLPEEQQARAAAFSPGGSYAKILATRPVMLVIGNSAFVHGGIRREHVEAGIDAMNQETAAWMLAQSPMPEFVKDAKGPLRMRDYSRETPKKASCVMLKDALAALGAKRMVVGHTIQDRGINAACDQKVWRTDIGLSAFYGRNRIQILEIKGNDVRVLSAPR